MAARTKAPANGSSGDGYQGVTTARSAGAAAARNPARARAARRDRPADAHRPAPGPQDHRRKPHRRYAAQPAPRAGPAPASPRSRRPPRREAAGPPVPDKSFAPHPISFPGKCAVTIGCTTSRRPIPAREPHLCSPSSHDSRKRTRENRHARGQRRRRRLPRPEDRALGGRRGLGRHAAGLLPHPGLVEIGAAQVRLLPMGGTSRQRRIPRFLRRARRPVDRLRVRYWRIRLGDRAWRRLEPGLWDYELAFGPVIDELAPDLIHAHDFRMLGVGARAATGPRPRPQRQAGLGRPRVPARRRAAAATTRAGCPAHLAYEREYVPSADAVVTVSDDPGRDAAGRPRAGRAARRGAERARRPPRRGRRAGSAGAVRRRPATPLLVYSGAAASAARAGHHGGGAAAAARGARGPGGQPTRTRTWRLLDRAEELGVADRVHVLPYVPHWQVCAFLAAADVGVIPIHHWPNHEIALITKFFEYSHARLPIVVSDVRTMADDGPGHRAGRGVPGPGRRRFGPRGPGGPGRSEAVPRGLRRPGQPAAEWTWEAQAEKLDALYRRLRAG